MAIELQHMYVPGRVGRVSTGVGFRSAMIACVLRTVMIVCVLLLDDRYHTPVPPFYHYLPFKPLLLFTVHYPRAQVRT